VLKRLKKIGIVFSIFILNASVTLAATSTPAPDTSGEEKLTGVINWIGNGARVVGVIGLIMGFWQLGMSFANDEPGERNKALMFLVFGLILFWAPQILLLLLQWNIIDPTKWG